MSTRRHDSTHLMPAVLPGSKCEAARNHRKRAAESEEMPTTIDLSVAMKLQSLVLEPASIEAATNRVIRFREGMVRAMNDRGSELCESFCELAQANGSDEPVGTTDFSGGAEVIFNRCQASPLDLVSRRTCCDRSRSNVRKLLPSFLAHSSGIPNARRSYELDWDDNQTLNKLAR
jgi:hypothetical protein